MKVIVTGSNGLVGSRLAKSLAASGHEVLGISRGPSRVATNGYRYQSVELSVPEQIVSALQSFRPEVVVNPASMTDVDGCEKDPAGAWAANAHAPAVLALECKKLGAHLLHVSTDYVFDGDGGPYREDDVPNPRGAYALTKHAGEQAVKALAGSWAIARTAVVYGWPAAGRPNFGAWLVGALQSGSPVKLFEDQYVSPSLATSVAAMLHELAERRLPGVWNVCGATVLNRVEFGRALCERFGFSPATIAPSRMADLKLASPRPLKSGLVVEKAMHELKAKPLELAEALEGFYREFKGAT